MKTTRVADMDDYECIEALREIDRAAESLDVTDWEAEFIDNVLTQQHWVSTKQREVIQRMLNKYGDQV